MRAFLFTLLTSLLLIPGSQAQEVSFYGYVKSETIHDTRQVAQVREGQFHLYPLRPQDDNLDGNADRDQNNLLMAAFQSRLGVKGSSDLPESGRVSATLEADFFGQNDTAVSNDGFWVLDIFLTGGRYLLRFPLKNHLESHEKLHNTSFGDFPLIHGRL